MTMRSTDQDVQGNLGVSGNVTVDGNLDVLTDLSVTGVNDLVQLPYRTTNHDYDDSDSLVSDTVLLLSSVKNGQVWHLRLVVYCNISDKGIKIKISTPSGSSGYWSGIVLSGTAVDLSLPKQGWGGTWNWNPGSAKAGRAIHIDAYVVVGSDGDINIQFANAVAGTGTLTIELGSNIFAART